MNPISQFVEATELMAKTLRSLAALTSQPVDIDPAAVQRMINEALTRYETAKAQLDQA